MKIRRKLFLILFIVLSYQKYAATEIATTEELKTDQGSVALREEQKTPNSCKQLNPGQSLTMNEGRSESPTGIERRYKLTKDKTNPNRYLASINLNFFTTYARIEEKYGSSPIAPGDIDSAFYSAQHAKLFNQT